MHARIVKLRLDILYSRNIWCGFNLAVWRSRKKTTKLKIANINTRDIVSKKLDKVFLLAPQQHATTMAQAKMSAAKVHLLSRRAEVYSASSSAILGGGGGGGGDGLYYSSVGSPSSDVCCRPTVNATEVWLALAVAAMSRSLLLFAWI